MKKRINKILWYGSELEDGKAKAPSASVEENGLDGLNEGELYVSNNEEDPALFTRTSNDKIVRLGEGNYKPFKFEYNKDIDALVLYRTDGKPAHFLATGVLATRALGNVEEEGTGGGMDHVYNVDDFSKALDSFNRVSETDTFNAYAIRSLYEMVKNIENSSTDTSYVDGKIEDVNKKIDTNTAYLSDWIERTEKTLQGNIDAVESALLENIDTVAGDLSTLQTTVNDFLTSTDTDTIINRWKELEAFLNGYTETATLADLLSGKADKATTLAGYGITNAYTKTEVDSKITSINTSVTTLQTTVSGHTTSINSLQTTVSGHTSSITSINSRITTLQGYFTDGVAKSALRLSDGAEYKAWGQVFFKEGKPVNVSGAATFTHITVESLTIGNTVFTVDGNTVYVTHKDDTEDSITPINLLVTGALATRGLGDTEEGGAGGADLSSVPCDILPSASSTYSIGSNTLTWKDGWFDELYVGGKSIMDLLAGSDEFTALEKRVGINETSVNNLSLRVTSNESSIADINSTLGRFGALAYKDSLAFSELTNKPTTLSGYGITDAYTISQADSIYVKKSGDAMTGTLSFSGSLSINIRGGDNSKLALGGADVQLVLDGTANAIRHSSTPQTLGTSSVRWSNVYSVLGNFSGQITSSVATGTAPFVVASTTEVANLHSATATKLHTARTIAISGAVTGAATYFDGSANISINTTSVDASKLSGYARVYYSHHPEDGGILPFIYNDLAHLIRRGGSCTIYKTTDTDYTQPILTNAGTIGSDYSNLFDGSPSYFSYSVSSLTDVVVIDIDCPEKYSYTTQFYIDFGTYNWNANSVKVYVWNDDENNTTQVYAKKAETLVWKRYSAPISYSYSNGTSTIQGFNKLRVVLTDFVGESPRIAQIGLINYNSRGLRNGYMSRGIDDQLYRSITPAKSSTYHLGTSANKWGNVYASNFYGNIKLSTPVTLWGQSFDGSGNVSGNLTGVGSITPSATTTYDLGSTSARWKGIYGQTLYLSGHIYLPNTGSIYAKNTSGSDIGLLYLNNVNHLLIGQHVARNGYNTNIYGNTISLCYGTAGSTNNTALYVNSDGNVGIGTTSPTYKLDVNGTFHASGNATVGGTLDVTGKFTGDVANLNRLHFTQSTVGTAEGICFINNWDDGAVDNNGVIRPWYGITIDRTSTDFNQLMISDYNGMTFRTGAVNKLFMFKGGNVLPYSNGGQSLGNNTHYWNEAYINNLYTGTVRAKTIYLDSTAKLTYDSTLNALLLTRDDGTVVHFLASGAVATRGLGELDESGGGSGTGVDLLNVPSDIIPAEQTTYKLGSSSNRWSLLYVNSINAGTIAPRTDNGWDLGMTTFRWRNLYAVDGHLDSLTIGGETAATQSYVTSQLSSYATTSELSNYVTLNSAQTISGKKTFTGGITANTLASATNNAVKIDLKDEDVEITAGGWIALLGDTYFGDVNNDHYVYYNGAARLKSLTLTDGLITPSINGVGITGSTTDGVSILTVDGEIHSEYICHFDEIEVATGIGSDKWSIYDGEASFTSIQSDNVLPKSNGSGNIGSSSLKWLNGYFNNLYSDVIYADTLTSRTSPYLSVNAMSLDLYECELYGYDSNNIDVWNVDFAGNAWFLSVTQTSDVRYKNIKENVHLKLSDIAAAPTFKFSWANETDGSTHIGTSAQYWQEIAGELVVANKKTGKLGLDYSTAALVSAISIAREINTMKMWQTTTTDRIGELEDKVKKLEEENKALRELLNNK